MTITLDTEAIKLITFFENFTGAPVKDCLIDNKTNTVYFLIEEGKIGMAIGKNGNNVKDAERKIKKTIKVIEFSSDLVNFVKNIIPQATDVKIRIENDKKIVEVRVEKNNKAFVIGRDGKNLKLYKTLLQRNYKISELIVK